MSTTYLNVFFDMNAGPLLKRGFNQLFNNLSGDVLVHKNWGKSSEKILTVRGLKNHQKGKSEKVIFQFPEKISIDVGDVIEQPGARDLWQVKRIEDTVVGGVYIHMEAWVDRFPSNVNEEIRSHSNVVFNGTVFGAVQVNSPQAVQNSNIQISDCDLNINHLKDLLKLAPVTEIQKEEASHALDRISQLRHKESTPESTAVIKSKLDLVKSAFGATKQLADAATPYIAAISQLISGS